MFKRIAVGALAVSAVLAASSASAGADLVQPTPQEVTTTAMQVCFILDRDPSPGGVIAGFEDLGNRGYAELPGAYIMYHSIIYICPQHEQLVSNTLDQLLPEILAEDLPPCRPS